MELAEIVKWQMNMYYNVYFELWIMKFIRIYEFVDIFLSFSPFLSDFIFVLRIPISFAGSSIAIDFCLISFKGSC